MGWRVADKIEKQSSDFRVVSVMQKRTQETEDDDGAKRPRFGVKFADGWCDIQCEAICAGVNVEIDELRANKITLEKEKQNDTETIRNMQSQLQIACAARDEAQRVADAAKTVAADNVHLVNGLETEITHLSGELDEVKQSRDKVRLSSRLLHDAAHAVGLICGSCAKMLACAVAPSLQSLLNTTKSRRSPLRSLLSSSIGVF